MAEVAVQRASGRGIWGWMFFDWAAQPFFTVVTTFIFGPYFASRMVLDPVAMQAAQAAGPEALKAYVDGQHLLGQTIWGYGIGAAGLVIAILSPILGSIADQTGPRKPWIAFFAAIKITSLCLLWVAAPGSSLFLAVALFALASVAAEFSTVFNDSMMPRLVPKSEIGHISNVAWGLGYLGGMIALIFVVLFMAGSPETGKTLIGASPIFGLDLNLGEDARATGPLSAGWYFLFILPMFFFTPDAIKGIPIGPAVREGLSELKSTLAEARKRVGIFRFLVARMIYQDGVLALLSLGAVFAQGMFNWSTTEVGLFGIILNVAAIFGCWIAARVDTALGSKAVVMISLVMLSVATIGVVSTGPGFTLLGLISFSAADSGGFFGTGAEKAYILYGLLIGLAFGPVQASSRSYMARSVTAAESGRYFGIYALSGRATSFLAPTMVSTIGWLSGSQRLGMAAIVLFLGIGMAILVRTPYPADRPAE
ncbi:MFS transporter [Mesorhizobium carmichaelinearum]|uniref:MFS transporter n=1 Tax=Mesorhizobium carmichaelinearum TaxID=1208188 RepID=UPI000BA2BC59|nr:MFS transporter [Mesorhizobium carmichaelinearum]